MKHVLSGVCNHCPPAFLVAILALTPMNVLNARDAREFESQAKLLVRWAMDRSPSGVGAQPDAETDYAARLL